MYGAMSSVGYMLSGTGSAGGSESLWYESNFWARHGARVPSFGTDARDVAEKMATIDPDVRLLLEWVFENALDEDKSGFIEEREANRVAKYCGYGGPDGDITALWTTMLSEMDSDGDQRISKEEYVVFMSKSLEGSVAAARNLKDEVDAKLNQNAALGNKYAAKEPTLAEKVSVLQRELNLPEGANLVDAVDNALEKLGLADELRGQPLTRKVDAALQTLGVTPQTSVPMGTPASIAPVTAPLPTVVEARVVQEVVASPPRPPTAIAALVGGHSTAKAAVEAGVDREEIVKVAMEDGEVMAWLLATIPEYAKEKLVVRGSSPLSRRSLASRACVRLSLPLTPRVCHTRHSCVLCVLPCAEWVAAAPLGR